MSDLIHVNELIGGLLNAAFKDDDDRDICYSVIRSIKTVDDVDVEENLSLKRQLADAIEAVEHNNKVVEQERLRHELYRKDGEISGLRFALRCITEGCRARVSLDEE